MPSMFKENYIYNWRTQIYYIQMREQRKKEIREGRVIFEIPLLYTDSAAFSKPEYLMEMHGKLKRSGPRRLAARGNAEKNCQPGRQPLLPHCVCSHRVRYDFVLLR